MAESANHDEQQTHQTQERRAAKGQYQMVASEKSWKRFKTNLKAITRKTAPMSFEEQIRKLNKVQRGWVIRLGSCPKSHFKHDHHPEKDEKVRISLHHQFDILRLASDSGI
jgi:hypothetical protein